MPGLGRVRDLRRPQQYRTDCLRGRREIPSRRRGRLASVGEHNVTVTAGGGTRSWQITFQNLTVAPTLSVAFSGIAVKDADGNVVSNAAGLVTLATPPATTTTLANIQNAEGGKGATTWSSAMPAPTRST